MIYFSSCEQKDETNSPNKTNKAKAQVETAESAEAKRAKAHVEALGSKPVHEVCIPKIEELPLPALSPVCRKYRQDMATRILWQHRVIDI